MLKQHASRDQPGQRVCHGVKRGDAGGIVFGGNQGPVLLGKQHPLFIVQSGFGAQISDVSAFWRCGIGLLRGERCAIVQHQAGQAHGAAHRFGPSDQIQLAGTGDFLPGSGKFKLGHLRIARQIS